MEMIFRPIVQPTAVTTIVIPVIAKTATMLVLLELVIGFDIMVFAFGKHFLEFYLFVYHTHIVYDVCIVWTPNNYNICVV